MITNDFQRLATQTDKNLNLRSQHLVLACSCPLCNSHQPYQGLPALFRSPGVQEVEKVFQSLNLCSPHQKSPFKKETEKSVQDAWAKTRASPRLRTFILLESESLNRIDFEKI